MATHLIATSLAQLCQQRVSPRPCPINHLQLLGKTPSSISWTRWRLPAQRSPTKCCAGAPPHVPPIWSLGTTCEDVMSRLHETLELKNCLGLPLTDDEQRSLLKCLDSTQLGVDSCLMEGLPALHRHLLEYIGTVASTQTDDLELVEGAMLLIEQLSLALGTCVVVPEGEADGEGEASDKEAPQQQQQQPQVESALQGQQQQQQQLFAGQQWQVLVTTAGGWPGGRVQYVPVIELLEVSEDGRRLRLETQTGPLYTLATGEVTWRPGGEEEAHLHLHYHVTEFRVEMFGGSLALPAPPPVPDNDLHIFALVSHGSLRTALARSSLGGITLMGPPV